MVPRAGLEPARAFSARGILSPLRLPIPPSRHTMMEAASGIEPEMGVLQTPALPLGYAATQIFQ